jgi:hypothetical protein
VLAPEEVQARRSSAPEGLVRRLAAPAIVFMSSLVSVWTLARTGASLADPDVWWHVRTGRLILDRHSIPTTDPFSFTTAAHSWVPTAWLSDVLFGAVWKLGSYEGIRVLRVTMAIIVLAVLWRLAQRYASSPSAAAASAGLVILTLSPFLAERPQVLSFIFVAWLSGQLRTILLGHVPRVWSTVGLCWLWANVHGMWFVLPVFVMTTGVFAWCEDRSRVSLAARCTLIALLAGLAAAVTPVGPRLALWPIVVSHVAAPISEWQPTVPLSAVGLPFLLLVVVIVASWAGSSERLPPGRMLFTFAAVAFGLSAFRNVAPAAILLLPEAAAACSLTLAFTPASPRAHRTTSRVAATAALIGLCLAGVRLTTSPTITREEPTRIAAELRARTIPVRVLNSYNVGGFLTGQATPGVRVAIDGRTDMWTSTFVVNYLEAISGRGDWRKLVDELRPDAAVLPADNQVAQGLRRERQWRVVMTDEHWQLLMPP